LEVWLTTGTGTGQVNIQMRKNGNSFALAQNDVPTINGLTLASTKTIYLNGTTDYVDFTIYSASITNIQLQAGSALGSGTFFSAALITSGNASWSSTGASNIYYTAGNVGIGTNAPKVALDVVGTTNLNNSLLQNPVFNSVKETITSVNLAATGGVTTVIDCSTGNNWNCTLTGAVGWTGAFSFVNAIATGTIQSMNLFVTQGTGGYKYLSYPASVTFGAQGVPTLSTGANQTDVLSFITYSGGSKWLGFLGGKLF